MSSEDGGSGETRCWDGVGWSGAVASEVMEEVWVEVLRLGSGEMGCNLHPAFTTTVTWGVSKRASERVRE